MKISFQGLDITEGKVKYNDEILLSLEKKFSPKKFSPFFVEFIKDNFEKADAIAILSENILNLLVLDMEKLETRLERSDCEEEKTLIKKCLAFLEKEKPLCDMNFSANEEEIIKMLAPLTSKPVCAINEKSPEINTLIRCILNKAGLDFFYTAGKQEVRSWLIKKGSDIVTCAGKIHSDLAKGFIKADVVNFSDFKNFHNLQDARSNGVVKLVDRDYIIQEGDIIEIRFNV
jgi:ribosome-binding ATPase YchF (GTP1/OBG family)